ncbi:hypothetical protein T484DRAFT_3637454 [Baffinella frigidus]|nr:hypothetical protein T484DRAFT_3637454 [Cryptophyta sp. CCMP2293]
MLCSRARDFTSLIARAIRPRPQGLAVLFMPMVWTLDPPRTPCAECGEDHAFCAVCFWTVCSWMYTVAVPCLVVWFRTYVLPASTPPESLAAKLSGAVSGVYQSVFVLLALGLVLLQGATTALGLRTSWHHGKHLVSLLWFFLAGVAAFGNF